MAWTRILPQRGARISVSPGVTVAWRVRSKGRPIMALTIAAHLARDLGWQPKQRVAVMLDDVGERVRLEPCDVAAEAFALHGAKGTGMLAAGFQLPGLALAESMKSEPAPFAVADGGLEVTLPKWAQAVGAIRTEAPIAAAPAAPPPAEPALPPLKWTPRRLDVLRLMYPAGESLQDIADAVNALPGEPATAGQCKVQAGNIGLRRPAVVAQAVPAKPPAPVVIDRPPPPRSANPIGSLSRANLPAERPYKAEAVKLLEAGVSGRMVADELGLSLGEVANWAAEVRAKKQGRAA